MRYLLTVLGLFVVGLSFGCSTPDKDTEDVESTDGTDTNGDGDSVVNNSTGFDDETHTDTDVDIDNASETETKSHAENDTGSDAKNDTGSPVENDTGSSAESDSGSSAEDTESDVENNTESTTDNSVESDDENDTESDAETSSESEAPSDTDTDDDTGSDSENGVWRPFNDDSPWNTKIPDNPALAPDSEDLIADFENSSPYGEHLDVNISGHSIPLYWADENTPKVEVTCRIGGMGFTGDDGFDATAMVPIPANAEPDSASDRHLLIVDTSTNLEWGMWDTVNDNGTWTCGLGANIDLMGSGVRPPANDNPTWYTSHGARACGFPLVAGLIRMDEIRAGRIDHALVVAYPHIRAGWYTPPASTAQARIDDDAIKDRGIPCGGRIQLDPEIDLESLGLSDSGLTICRALQEYGAYVGDYSGAISLYAENSPEAQEFFANGVLDSYELDGLIDLAWFRVLEMGEMYDNGNGD